jgi:inorganic pyrophosphatase
VLVVYSEASFVGCLLKAKVIGAFRAEQTEQGKTIRNDRLLAVPVTKVNPAEFSNIDELSSVSVSEIEHFFVSYNKAHGREFRPTGRVGPQEADRIVAAAIQRYEASRDR